MAKWGQGDPRWIVEERADATNVNNWHWTERDATGWSKSKLKEVLVGLAVEGEAGRCEISELKQAEGEASCSSRKGKLIFFYEWNLRLAWRGTVKESGEKHKGSVEIPNLSEENEVDDTEINVSKKKGEGDVLKDLMRTEGTTKVREALRDYLKALKTEFTLGMILPTKAAGQDVAAERKLSGNAVQASVSPHSSDIVGVKIPTVKIVMREIFSSPADELYSVFTTKELVQKFSKCPAVIEAEKGGKLQMFDGCVSGEYAELVPSQRIVLKWRCRNWPDEHYATVTLNFKDMAAETELQLECKGHQHMTTPSYKLKMMQKIMMCCCFSRRGFPLKVCSWLSPLHLGVIQLDRSQNTSVKKEMTYLCSWVLHHSLPDVGQPEQTGNCCCH